MEVSETSERDKRERERSMDDRDGPRMIRKRQRSGKNVEANLKAISSTFCEQFLCRYSFAKKLQSQTVYRENLHKAFLYEKGAHKMLMKLTPGSQLQSVSQM